MAQEFDADFDCPFAVIALNDTAGSRKEVIGVTCKHEADKQVPLLIKEYAWVGIRNNRTGRIIAHEGYLNA